MNFKAQTRNTGTLLKRTPYLPMLLMGVSAFVMNTTEFVPVALLSDIAADFSITTAHAGWMLTLYAWAVALLSLPLMWVTRHLERKRLLLVLFAVFIVSHALSAVAWRYEVLLLSRIAIAFTHALFWSITAAITIRVAPHGKKALALSVLATGSSLAMVLGVPLGRLIGQWFGWRITFAVIGVIALGVAGLHIKVLPTLPSQFQGTLKKIPQLLKNPMLLSLYGICFIAFAAHYTAYTYIEPFLSQVGAVSDNGVTLVLLLIGVAGIVGSVIFSHCGERYSAQLTATALLLLLVVLSTLVFAVASVWMLGLSAIAWGIAVMLLVIALKYQVLLVDQTAQDMLMSLFSGIINVGIGTGALLGGYVVTHLSLAYVGFAGAAIVSVALLLMVVVLQRCSPQL